MAKKISITWKKSAIGAKPQHKRTIRALGLRRLNHTVIKDDSPQARGMAESVCHLVEIKEVES